MLEVQCLLRSRGYELALDGDFGPDTENRVMLLQACMGLTIDGKVGVNTWRALRSNGCDHDG
ncbi:peptidoglycan-binding protein [Streptomyces sp. NPDC057854]|uniref:peptidoglycan-binding domain-containing protein n=1 Tax=unclassified Streptomyces TaxID=2593676 RepID=UPI0036A13323